MINYKKTTKRDWNVRSFGQRVGAVTVVLLFVADAGGAERAYVTDRQGQRPQPIVAIDNVCAWPNLTVLRDGTIVATIFNHPSHGTTAGDVECWASADGGRTWHKRGTPAEHENEHSNRMNVAAGLATNGDLLVIASGWTGLDAASGELRRPFRERILTPWVSRSADGGKTWSVDKQAFPGPWPPAARQSVSPEGICVPFGDILAGQDGALRVAMYTGARGAGFVFRSDDDGKTWGEPVAFAGDAVLNEPAIFHLGGGKWLAATRSNGLDLYASDDDAKNWTHREKVTGPQQHPGHIMRLADRRLLLTYGNRLNPKGIDMRLSADEGHTWTDPVRVADFQGDGGYPSSVQLPDGQVLTAFYGQPYHMGAVVWEPPAIVLPHDASDDVHEEAERMDETIRPEVVVTMGARELVRPRDAMPFVMDSTLATLRRDAKTWFFYHSTDWGKDNEKFLGTPSDPFQNKVWRKGRDELYDLNGWYADVHHAGLWLNNIYQLDDGHLLGVVHVELHYQAPRVYQGEDYAIGVVYSTDGGDRWTYCGEIVRPQNSKLNVGGTPLLVVGDHFHVYFNDHGPGGRKLAVARARISDVRAAARQHKVTTWRKYRDGSWNEDGLTGLGSAVLPDCEIGGGHPADLHADAAYNRAVGLHMITRWSYAQGVGRLYLHLSPDGIHFDRQYLVDEEPGQWMPYSTFIADEQDQETNDMSSVGAEFWVLINHKNATNYGADALHWRRISISRK